MAKQNNKQRKNIKTREKNKVYQSLNNDDNAGGKRKLRGN